MTAGMANTGPMHASSSTMARLPSTRLQTASRAVLGASGTGGGIGFIISPTASHYCRKAGMNSMDFAAGRRDKKTGPSCEGPVGRFKLELLRVGQVRREILRQPLVGGFPRVGVRDDGLHRERIADNLARGV